MAEETMGYMLDGAGIGLSMALGLAVIGAIPAAALAAVQGQDLVAGAAAGSLLGAATGGFLSVIFTHALSREGGSIVPVMGAIAGAAPVVWAAHHLFFK